MADRGRHGRGRSVRRARGSLVLCAIVLVAACGPPSAGSPPPAREGGRLRGLQPAGDVRLPLVFAWDGVDHGTVMRITVSDAAERTVFTFDTRGSRASAPGGLDRALAAGERFSWTVAALDETERPLRISEPVAFVIRPGP